jgi:hypothetical protein
MSQFEYLSVLVSIIVGLGISHLLSSTARLIQVRRHIRFHAPTLFWMGFLLLVQVQVWWVAFARRTATEWQFFVFLLYLFIPVGVFLLSYLIVPDLREAKEIDLRASYHENRLWLYGIFALVVVTSLANESVEAGVIPTNLDALLRLGFLGLALVGLLFRGERVHFAASLAILVGFIAYVLLLFIRLA